MVSLFAISVITLMIGYYELREIYKKKCVTAHRRDNIFRTDHEYK